MNAELGKMEFQPGVCKGDFNEGSMDDTELRKMEFQSAFSREIAMKVA